MKLVPQASSRRQADAVNITRMAHQSLLQRLLAYMAKLVSVK